MVSIHGPLGYEPNTLATAPLRCGSVASRAALRNLQYGPPSGARKAAVQVVTQPFADCCREQIVPDSISAWPSQFIEALHEARMAVARIRHMAACCLVGIASCFLASSQFARVVKGVDLRSTAGNCAWVRAPQLTGQSCQPILTRPMLCNTTSPCRIARERNREH